MSREPEEGEVSDSGIHNSSGEYGYDSAYEWPGDTEPSGPSSPYSEPVQPPANKFRPGQPSFRLVIQQSSILPLKQRLAIIDGYSELQFGRDIAPAGSTTPKIRLKEMEVSKLHATAYWDGSKKEWGLVDMGSVHGTFVRPSTATGDDRGVRLSPPRQASIPRPLKHMDRLSIGGTTFIIHLHKYQRPCEQCYLDGKEEIPLFPAAGKSKISTPTKAGESQTEISTGTPTDPKKALTLLKQSLLARHHDPNLPATSSAQYMDRSARRREMTRISHGDAPGVPPASTWMEKSSSGSRAETLEPVSQSPTPVSASNIGHRLLVKQGWKPGMALGVELDPSEDRVGLVEPLEISGTVNRAGLGLKRSKSELDWRENGKRSRRRDV